MSNYKKYKKWIIALTFILVTGAVGFGYNFFNWNENKQLKNEALTVNGGLNVENIVNQQNLVPGDKMCDEVNLNINSTAVSLLRVKIEVKSGDQTMSDGYIIKGIDSENWIKGNDGYYYYKTGVNENSGNSGNIKFATGIYFGTENEDINMNDYQGKQITADIKAEMIQAKHGVFETAWNISQTDNQSVYDLLKSISDAQGND